MQENRKTKVCLAITKGVWGGAQKYVYTVAALLPAEQYDVSVICGEGDALPEKLAEKDIPTYRLPALRRDISLAAEIKSFFSLLSFLRTERPDVLHLNSSKIGFIGSVAGRIARVPRIIFTAHGWAFNERRSPLSQAGIAALSWMTVALCHTTIVIADREEKQARAMPCIPRSKIVLIRNGIEGKATQSKASARQTLHLLGKTDIAPHALWLGTIAELHKNKGLEYAITALSKLTVPYVFYIIGEGEERKHLQSLIESLHLAEKIVLVGFMADAASLLSAFDIFLLPSVKEGLPYALLEAGAAGLPIIASSVGGTPDIIQTGADGILVTPARPGEITRAIEYLVANPEIKKTFGKNIQEKIKKNFSLVKMIEKTLDAYGEK